MAIFTESRFAHLKKLRQNEKMSFSDINILNSIVWYSFPIVYPDFRKDVKVINLNYEKQISRRKRIRKYIRGMFDTFDNLFLVSLTFDDYFLNNVSSDVRKRYIREWLNSYTLDYFCCIDFGTLNGREHYHAICSFAPEDIVKGKFYEVKHNYPYGFLSLRLIKKDIKDAYKSLNYAVKSSNYAFKRADSNIKPFHKRGVLHWVTYTDGDIF